MSTLALQKVSAIESALIEGDLSKLTEIERLNYFKSVCESVGLNPMTKPFDYIRLNGKLVLYAKRDATDQLRKVHKVSIAISAREVIGDIYVVTAKARDKDGREDESTGAVSIKGLAGESLANAYMKAETKAKRRVTLSVCGLGILDESEVSSIPGAEIPAQNAADPVKAIESKPVLVPEIEKSPGEYVIPFGKFKGKKVSEVDAKDLDGYCAHISKQAKEKGETIRGAVLDLMNNAAAYLDSLEAPKPQPDFATDEIPF